MEYFPTEMFGKKYSGLHGTLTKAKIIALQPSEVTWIFPLIFVTSLVSKKLYF